MDAHSIFHPLMDRKASTRKKTQVHIVWTSIPQLHCFAAQIDYTVLLTNAVSAHYN